MKESFLISNIASIKHAVASSSSCTQEAVDALNLALNPPRPTNSSSTSAPEDWPGPKPISASRVLGNRRGRLKQEPEVIVIEVVDNGGARLQQGEVARLATEVVNSTLKSLTEAIKSSSGGGFRQKSNPPSHASSQSDNKKNGIAKPLQPRSRNRILTSTSDETCSRRSSFTTSSNAFSGIIALAECARIAFSALRRIDQLNKANKTTSSFQIESGMSALIGKLIALGLDDLASKELRILAKRLQMGSPISNTTQEQNRRKEVVAETNPSKQTLTNLYRIAQIPEDDRHLSLVIASQLHVTKLLALKKRKISIEAAYDHLDPSTSHSPLNLINKSISTDSPLSKDRAIRQLENLAQHILSLCPSQTVPEDDVKDTSMSVSAGACLRFQLLALRVRWKSWLLANHRVDMQKQVLDPYNKYIHNFLRATTSSSNSRYSSLKDATHFLSNLITLEYSLDTSQKLVYDLSCTDSFKLLADLACRDENPRDAESWSNQSILSMDTASPSQARRCTLLCHAAEIKIRCSLLENHIDGLDKKLDQANSALKSDLQGSSSELDELLISCASLRKHVSLVLLDSFKGQKHSVNLTSREHISCSNVLLSNVRLLVRYLGKAPGLGSANSSMGRYEQRLKLTERIAKPTVEAIISLAKLPLVETPEIWKALDEALQQSTQLCVSLGTSGLEEGTQKASLAVQISSAYWLQYLRLKANRAPTSELLNLLQKSIDLLKEQAPLEKEQGILHTKLEKLGALYEAQNKQSKATIAYSSALDTLISFKELRLAAQKAAVSPLSHILQGDGAIGAFKRVLTAYFNTCNDNSITVLDPSGKDWSLQEYGFILETQLTILADLAKTRPMLASIHAAIKRVSQSLLEVYTYSESPLRRLRVSVQILRCRQSIPTLFSSSSIDILSHEVFDTQIDADFNLKPYKDHWLAQRDSLLAIAEDGLNIDLLEAAFERWLRLCHHENGLSIHLEERIDDIPALAIQLSSIAEYLYMQGLEIQRVTVLQLMLSILQSQSMSMPSQYVTNVAALGDQLLRLGHSSQGGICLQKARKYLEDKTLCKVSSLNWHLSYANYLIEIGNVAKGEEYSEKAKELFHKMVEAGILSNRVSDRYNEACIAADLMHTLSKATFAQGKLAWALFYAKKAVRLSYRAWALLERRNGTKNCLQDQSAQSDSEVSTASLPVMSTKHESLKSILFWPIVPRLFRHLTRLSSLLGHEGSLTEARFYLDQAAKVAQAVQADSLLVTIKLLHAELDTSSGQNENAIAGLKAAKSMTSVNYPAHLNISIDLALARAYARIGDHENENLLLEAAQSILRDNTTIQITADRSSSPRPSDDLIQQMEHLRLDAQPKKQVGKAKRGTVIKQGRARLATKTVAEKVVSKPQSEREHLTFTKSRISVLRQRGASYSRQTDFERAADLLDQARALSLTYSDTLLHSLELACHLLRQGLSGLLADPVFSVLQDSTISCPSSVFSRSSGAQEAPKLQTLDTDQNNATKKTRGKAEPKPLAKKRALPRSHLTGFLSSCFDILSPLHSNAQRLSSSSTMHRLTDVLSKTLLMLSTANSTSPSISISSTFAAYAMGKLTRE